MTKFKKTHGVLRIGGKKQIIQSEYVEIGAGELNALLAETNEENERKKIDELIKKSNW